MTREPRLPMESKYKTWTRIKRLMAFSKRSVRSARLPGNLIKTLIEVTKLMMMTKMNYKSLSANKLNSVSKMATKVD